MSDIKVITTDLRSSSQQLTDASSGLSKIQTQITASNTSKGLYDGQLQSKLDLITVDAYHTSAQLQNRSGELAGELLERANKFEAANETNNNAMVNLFNLFSNFVENSPILKSLAFLNNSNLAKAFLFWGLGGFVMNEIVGLITRLPDISKGTVVVDGGSQLKMVNITTPINLRASANLLGQKIATLPTGSQVTQISDEVIDKDNHRWIRARTSDGKEGWIASDILDNAKKQAGNSTIATKGPVQGVIPVLTQGIHYSGDSKDGKRGVAIDIGTGTPEGAEIHSLSLGKVVEVGPDLDDKGNLHDYGNYIKILQDDGKIVLYAHMKEQPSNINQGDRIESGQKIGMMGSTGRSTGPHLHLEFREPKFDDKGNYVGDTTTLVKNKFDPSKYLEDLGIKL